MDRVTLRKRKRMILRGVRLGVSGLTLLLVFAIVGGIEAGTLTLGMAAWLLMLCMAVLWILVGIRD